MLSRENEKSLFEEIKILKDKWFREMNLKRQEIPKNGANSCSTYRIQLANNIYSSGQKAEVSGYFQIAVEQYRRATSLVPDIDRNFRLQSIATDDEMSAANIQPADPTSLEESLYISDHDYSGESVELQGSLLQLPDEILFLILRWVVGSDLDLFSLSIYSLV